MGYPQVSLSNTFTTIGSATGFTSRVDRDFELYDNVTIQRGAHTIKFGGYFFHLNFNPSYPNDARGVYTYSGAYSGNAAGRFPAGLSRRRRRLESAKEPRMPTPAGPISTSRMAGRSRRV